MIEWWPVLGDKMQMISDCGKYRITKNDKSYPCEYTPQYLDETVNSEGVAIQTWRRIEKPKHSADAAKEVCEKWKEQNNKNAKN